jgi:pilus assembly protein Flp/PilA
VKSIITKFLRNTSGATAIEYGLIAAGLAVVMVAVFGQNGTVDALMTTLFSVVADNVGSAAGGTGGGTGG